METDTKFIEEILDASEESRIELTQWEEEFLESLTESNRSLSKKQRETVDRIHQRVRLW